MRGALSDGMGARSCPVGARREACKGGQKAWVHVSDQQLL